MDEWLGRYKRAIGVVAVLVLVASGAAYVVAPLLLKRLFKKWPSFSASLVFRLAIDGHCSVGPAVAPSIDTV